jgi:hypothetical protein
MPAKNLAQIAALPLDILRAAHLVDRVFPDAPVRQWVLRLPHTLRYRMAYDSKLVSAIYQIFVQAVFASLRRRVRIVGMNCLLSGNPAAQASQQVLICICPLPEFRPH